MWFYIVFCLDIVETMCGRIKIVLLFKQDYKCLLDNIPFTFSLVLLSQEQTFKAEYQFIVMALLDDGSVTYQFIKWLVVHV